MEHNLKASKGRNEWWRRRFTLNYLSKRFSINRNKRVRKRDVRRMANINLNSGKKVLFEKILIPKGRALVNTFHKNLLSYICFLLQIQTLK